MMPPHPDRVRRNYLSDKHYAPCDRYTEHVYDKHDICIFCHKFKQDIERANANNTRRK